MTHRARLQIASLVAALFLGGLVVLGIGLNSSRTSRKLIPPPPKVRTVTVHETKTIHVPVSQTAPPREAPQPQPSVAIAQQSKPAVVPVRAAPVVVQGPAKIRSRVSPVGGGEKNEGEGHDEGESEGSDD